MEHFYSIAPMIKWYTFILSNIKSRRLLHEWLEAALILMNLDLEPARPILESLYSPDPRGQKPYEPVRMLRALLLMVLLRYTSITRWAKALKAKPRLACIAGFEPYDIPAAGTFYAFIALNPRSGTYPSPTGTAKRVNENGVPICPGGMLMRRMGFDPKRHRVYYGCPVKRPTHRKDEGYIYINHVDECPLGVLCQPDTKHGPVVYIKTADDPRLYPPISRASPKYKKLMNLRSGCERSNSQKKEVYGLGNRPCRSETHFLVRLYLVSIMEHAKAWLAEDRKKLGDNPNALMDSRAA